MANFLSLRSYLDIHGFAGLRLIRPSIELCTDNAAMIAWAGMEMFDQGWTTKLSCLALRKWSIDPMAGDGGILGVTGWNQAQGQGRVVDSGTSDLS